MKKNRGNTITDAFSLFPDLFKQQSSPHAKADQKKRKKVLSTSDADFLTKQQGKTVIPPPPPDLSWLRDGSFDNTDHDNPEDIPSVLILSKEKNVLGQASSSFEGFGYRIETADDAIDAIHRISSFTYAAICLHSSFEDVTNKSISPVHSHITWLPMDKRRLIYYILVGPNFTTLYDLEALSYSANLVVNDANFSSLSTILRKSLREYEELFAPLIEAMEGNNR